MSLTHDVDLKGKNFRRITHPQTFTAVAFVFSELERGASEFTPPPPQGRKKPGLDIGLNSGANDGLLLKSISEMDFGASKSVFGSRVLL